MAAYVQLDTSIRQTHTKPTKGLQLELPSNKLVNHTIRPKQQLHSLSAATRNSQMDQFCQINSDQVESSHMAGQGTS